MTQTDLEIYGIAHLIRDYARNGAKCVLTITDIDEFLFSMGIKLSESELFDTLKEMVDAGWVRELDYNNRLVFFNERVLKAA